VLAGRAKAPWMFLSLRIIREETLPLDFERTPLFSRRGISVALLWHLNTLEPIAREVIRLKGRIEI
jgi:hypothetical protein